MFGDANITEQTYFVPTSADVTFSEETEMQIIEDQILLANSTGMTSGENLLCSDSLE